MERRAAVPAPSREEVVERARVEEAEGLGAMDRAGDLVRAQDRSEVEEGPAGGGMGAALAITTMTFSVHVTRRCRRAWFAPARA